MFESSFDLHALKPHPLEVHSNRLERDINAIDYQKKKKKKIKKIPSQHAENKNWQIILPFYICLQFSLFCVCAVNEHKTTLISSTSQSSSSARRSTKKNEQNTTMLNVIFCNKFEWFSIICFSLSFPPPVNGSFFFAQKCFRLFWTRHTTIRVWSIWNGREKCPLLAMPARCVYVLTLLLFEKAIQEIIDGH